MVGSGEGCCSLCQRLGVRKTTERNLPKMGREPSRVEPVVDLEAVLQRWGLEELWQGIKALGALRTID